MVARRGAASPRFGRRAAISLLTVAAISGAASASAAQPSHAHPADIDRNGVLILIRSTLMAVEQANETGNYTVVRDLGAPVFRENNSAARLGEIFSSLRAKNLDLSGVQVLEPRLTLLPQIEPSGVLHMAGFFPSAPEQIHFELGFTASGGKWRLSGISVGIEPSAPMAPAPSSGGAR